MRLLRITPSCHIELCTSCHPWVLGGDEKSKAAWSMMPEFVLTRHLLLSSIVVKTESLCERRFFVFHAVMKFLQFQILRKELFQRKGFENENNEIRWQKTNCTCELYSPSQGRVMHAIQLWEDELCQLWEDCHWVELISKYDPVDSFLVPEMGLSMQLKLCFGTQQVSAYFDGEFFGASRNHKLSSVQFDEVLEGFVPV